MNCRFFGFSLLAPAFGALLVAPLGMGSPARALDVVSTTPSAYELNVSSGLTTITWEFDAAISSPATSSVRVCGTMSGLKTGVVSALGTTLTFTTSDPWLAGELVNINLKSDVQTPGGDALTNGHYFAFTIVSQPASVDWGTPLAYGAANVPYFIFGGDLDGDGTPDVAAPNEGTNDVSIFLNQGNAGLFPTHLDYPVGDTPSSIFGEDFDNDFDFDWVTADIASGTATVGLNQGDGTFGPTTSYLAGVTTRQVHGGDFDGDNDIDFAATSRSTDEVYLFFNDGTGSFTAAPPYTDVQAGPFAIRTGDFNLDGLLDIAVACQDADSVSVLTNVGGGTFVTTGRFQTGNGPWCLNGNDFDGDGDFDLVTVASFNNRIQVLFNDGAGNFPTKLGKPTGAFPLGVFAADLNGDGHIDATSSNFSGRSVGIYLNDGTGTLNLQTNLPVARTGSYTWAHDLDADGDLDLSIVDELADSLFVYYNGASPPVDVPATSLAGSETSIRVAPNPASFARGVDLDLVGFQGPVELSVHSVDGRRVRSLARPDDSSRSFWDGRDDRGRAVPAGVYWIRARSGEQVASSSVRLLR